MGVQTDHALTPQLVSLMAAYPRLDLALSEEITYRRFRSIEPRLVSCLDGQVGPDRITPHILEIQYEGQPVGVVSHVVQTNARKPFPANQYGRIDLVIMDKRYRGLGLGRVLVLGALAQLIAQHHNRLYSISCLAAHGAIAKILEELNFSGEIRSDKNFKHEEFKLDGVDQSVLLETLVDKTAAAAQQANFRMRQQMGAC